jgi:hypothetical protein
MHADLVRPGYWERDHSLSMIPTENRHVSSIERGRPARHPRVRDDEQARRFRRDSDSNVVRVGRVVFGRFERLTLAGGGQRIALQEHPLAP